MKYTEPKGVLPDFLLKDTINLNELLGRWNFLLDYKIEIRELKIMLSESSTDLHMYREPDSDHEQTMRSLSIHYGTSTEQFNYYAPNNFYVFKEDLIKAEIFLGIREEIKIPERRCAEKNDKYSELETNHYNKLGDKRKRQVDTIEKAIEELDLTKIESGTKPIVKEKCKEIAIEPSDFEIEDTSFNTIWQQAKKSGRVRIS